MRTKMLTIWIFKLSEKNEPLFLEKNGGTGIETILFYLEPQKLHTRYTLWNSSFSS